MVAGREWVVVCSECKAESLPKAEVKKTSLDLARVTVMERGRRGIISRLGNRSGPGAYQRDPSKRGNMSGR